MASHELKTPITSLKGMIQLTKRILEKQGVQEPIKYLSKMDAQINNLTRLIDELLDGSKIQAGKLDYREEFLDINALVQDLVEILQQINPTHAIQVNGSTDKHVVGDGDRLGQVFTNLITNAVKYSPQANKVEVNISSSQDFVIVSVRDYGVGIPKEHQSKIFDRFYRVSGAKGRISPGLGMGLYISSEIVKRHGGDIRVSSEEGKGSIFSVSLPLLSDR